MQPFYSLAIWLVGVVARLVAWWDPKARKWVAGRERLWGDLASAAERLQHPVWFHASSLGEFEQGRPVIEALKHRNPNLRILLTFFSPSGYEVQKDYAYADLVCYLPLDTPAQVRRFLAVANPRMAVFIKNDFWPNLLRELGARKVPTYSISAVFQQRHWFFRFYGKWFQRCLRQFTHIFVQDQESAERLKKIGLTAVTVCGDTRFDRVAAIKNGDNQLGFMERFAGEALTVVAGSTWPEDDRVLVPWVQQWRDRAKFVLVPHNLHEHQIQFLEQALGDAAVRYSELEDRDPALYRVLILDTVGLLTKIYSYADLAFVGGGFGREGVHNVLEPATFGVPVITGPIFHQFQEAIDLQQLGALLAVRSAEELIRLAEPLAEERERERIGRLAAGYVAEKTGATDRIVSVLQKAVDD